MKKYLEIGKILTPHGADGMVKVQPWCDSPDVICGLKRVYVLSSEIAGQARNDKAESEYSPPGRGGGEADGVVSLIITRAFPHKNHVCVKIDGYDTIEQAQKLHGITLFAARTDLEIPEGSHFIADLIGTPVIDARSGRVYGILANVNTNTRNHIYEITTDSGMVMLPVVEEFVADIRPGEGIFVTPIEGFFDEI